MNRISIGDADVPVGNKTLPDRRFRGAWTLSGNVILVDLADAKHIALADVDQAYATTLRVAVGDPTIEERDTWPAKELAAHAVINKTARPAQIQLLSEEAEERGLPVEAFAEFIVGKADAMAVLVGRASRIRQRTENAIKSAKTVQAITDAIKSMSDAFEGLIGQGEGGA